ncbi:hypothetical protein [Lysinibacillus sp. GbtcB16]|uniref:hypothetical protein n=1 Tax=Lysinibacillus sp. GbtcB16 TaxID=2824761 RepID=UPI001C3060EB|nr:hypothetical protein [Lysinibacillus sp. GbtcB16]
MDLQQKMSEYLEKQPNSFIKKCADYVRKKGINNIQDDAESVSEAIKTHPNNLRDFIAEQKISKPIITNNSGRQY